MALLLAFVLVLDQVSKALVRDRVNVGDSSSVLPGLDLVHTKNRGVAFSVLEDQAVVVTVVIALAMVALLAYVARHAARPGIWVPAGLLAGGAIGNIIDRIRDGAVTDFIKLPSWPAFNVADMAITVGVLALLYVMERSPREDRDEQAGAAVRTPADAGPLAATPGPRTPDAADRRP